MKRRQQNLFIISLLGPPFALFALFVLLPAFTALKFSLTRWDGLGAAAWVGLKNFVTVLSPESGFPKALGNNLFLMFVPGPIILALALFFAFNIHQNIRGARLFRIAFFFPNVISSVAVALLWILIYSPSQAGLLNGLLRVAMHRTEPIAFADHNHLMWALVPMLVWSATGFYMVLFLAAMENIPESFYEA